jgi:hypothetical protein
MGIFNQCTVETQGHGSKVATLIVPAEFKIWESTPACLSMLFVVLRSHCRKTQVTEHCASLGAQVAAVQG